MISIILLAYNEAKYIEKALRNLQKLKCVEEFEIIIADGGSTDQTTAIASLFGKVIQCDKGKACQMNTAAATAQGEVLFFVHADMVFPEETLNAIHHHVRNLGYDGGGFANVFDRHNEKIKHLGTIMNFRFLNKKEQSDRNIFYGDNGIFVKSEVFEALGGFKEIPIMEDYDFSTRMKAGYRVTQIREPRLIVSARRHIRAGFFKTRLQWILIKKLYLLGIPPRWLAAWYKDVK